MTGRERILAAFRGDEYKQEKVTLLLRAKRADGKSRRLAGGVEIASAFLLTV
jgi:hypothetical protein